MWRPRRFTARRSAAQPPPQQRRSRRHHQRPPPPPPWAASSGRSLRAQHIPHRRHVRRRHPVAAARSPPRVPELQPEMQSTGIETHIHHQNVQASQKKIRQDTRYARCGGCDAAAATRLRRLQKEVALCWVILPIYVHVLHRFGIDLGFHYSLSSLNKLSEF